MMDILYPIFTPYVNAVVLIAYWCALVAAYARLGKKREPPMYKPAKARNLLAARVFLCAANAVTAVLVFTTKPADFGTIPSYFLDVFAIIASGAFVVFALELRVQYKDYKLRKAIADGSYRRKKHVQIEIVDTVEPFR
jgi:hypothetical protein